MKLNNFNNHQKAILALILANLIWGAAAPIFKWSFTNVEPFTMAFLRFGLSTLLLTPLVLGQMKIKKEHWLNLILLSLFGITFNISFFFLGLKIAPAINAPMIATAGPVFLLIGSFFVLKERIRPKIVFGTSLGLIGVLLIILRPMIEDGFDVSIFGNFLFVAATLSGVTHAIFTKKIAPFYSPVVLTFWSFLIGTVTFLPLFFWEIKNYGFLTNLQIPGVIGILFGVYLCSTVAYFCYHWAIKYLYAQEVGVFAYLDPIVAIIIAIPLLGELPTPIYLLGSLFVFLGIFIAEGRLPYHPLQKWREKAD